MTAIHDDASVVAFPAPSERATQLAEHPTRIAQPPSTLNLSNLPRLVSTRAMPYLVHQIHYIGRTGVIGITLFVFSTIWFLSANSPLRGQLSEQRAEIAGMQQSHARGAPDGGVSQPAQLTALMSKLPARAELPALTEQIVAQADAAGLALDVGSYDVNVVRSGPIVRARLSFPVHGSYPNIRRFIDGTLATIPGAAVDGLRIERKEIGAAEIDADIRLAVYLKNAP